MSRVAAATVATLVLALASPAGASTTTTTTTTPSLTAGPDQVVVSSFSEKGDFIDRGVSSIHSSHWTKVSASVTGIALSYVNQPAKASANYTFDPVAGQDLAVGEYDNLQRAETRSAGFAGIDITGPGEPAGCSRVTGSFHIWDLAANASGAITRLDLTYVEHCGAGRPSNFGEVLINDAPQVGLLYASARRLTFPDQTPTLPYVVTNPTPRSQPISLWQSTTTVSHYSVTPATPSCATSVRARSSCTYDVRLIPPRPGAYATVVLVVSGQSLLRLSVSGTTGGL